MNQPSAACALSPKLLKDAFRKATQAKIHPLPIYTLPANKKVRLKGL